MSTPLIFILLPGVAGLVFWFMRKRFGLILLLSTILCLLLAALAWLLPIGQTIRLFGLSFTIDPTLAFAGRRLVLDVQDRSFLVFIYMLCAFWFAGSAAAHADHLLISFGLGIVALLVAAQAVEPFLYAALLVEMAVLLAVPILAPPGKIFSQGVLRFLIFQTLAMPFILLAGWAIAGVEANPADSTLVTLSTVFLGLGFAFWLAVFPFYTWVPLLAEQSSPYVTGFIFLLLPTNNLLIGLGFVNQFGWLRASPDLFLVIGQIGALMVVTAGIWAAFQRDLARLMGYAVIIETGFSLLAISLSSRDGNVMFASMFLPRVIGIALWALSLSILSTQTRTTRFDDMLGIAQKMPFASTGFGVASLTLAGLPLLAVFPIRQVLLEELARQSLVNSLWALVGTVGMLFSTFRALSILVRGASLPVRTSLPVTEGDEPQTKEALPQLFCESRTQIALLVGGIISLLLIGLFPQAFLPLLNGLLAGYPQLP
jgi:formate hydrogenlyase subunit 3/multisubunit Na+/H+ antiporter MnhD subunit